MGCLRSATGPGSFLGVWGVFPIRTNPRVTGNAVSPPLVPGRTGGRDHASEPRRCRPRLRCWTSPSAHLVGGALLASAPVLRPHPVQRNATKASICIRANELESIEVLITQDQPGSCPLRDGRCLRSIGTAFTLAGLRSVSEAQGEVREIRALPGREAAGGLRLDTPEGAEAQLRVSEGMISNESRVREIRTLGSTSGERKRGQGGE